MGAKSRKKSTANSKGKSTNAQKPFNSVTPNKGGVFGTPPPLPKVASPSPSPARKQLFERTNSHNVSDSFTTTASATAPSDAMLSNSHAVRVLYGAAKLSNDNNHFISWCRLRCSNKGSGFYVANDVRSHAWCAMMSSEMKPANWVVPPPTDDNSEPIAQARVLECDIARSLWTQFPEDEERDAMRVILKRVITRVLSDDRTLHYYQGMHDVTGVVLMVSEGDEERTAATASLLMKKYFTRCATSSLKETEAVLLAIHEVLRLECPELATVLEDVGVAPSSHYALSWVITWFSHLLHNQDLLLRLFDFFVASDDENILVFAAAALVLDHKENNVFQEANVETFPEVYSWLVKLPTSLEELSSVEVNEFLKRVDLLREKYTELIPKIVHEALLPEPPKHVEEATCCEDINEEGEPAEELDCHDDDESSGFIRTLEVIGKLAIVTAVLAANIYAPLLQSAA